MSYTEEQTPASVVAQAVADIVMIGSQRNRDLCFQLSGVRNLSDFTLTLERALNGFFHHREYLPLNAQFHWSSEPHFSINQSKRDQTNFCSSCLQLNNEDFSSTEDETNTDIPRATMDQEDLLNSPSIHAYDEDAMFSPERNSSSTIDEELQQPHFPCGHYFSDEELDVGLMTDVPTLSEKFPNSSKSGKNKISVKTYAGSIVPQHTPINEFSD